MSSALTHSSSSAFAQQGTVDWVSLSNTSVTYSVAVLARLSRAGIDLYTLQVGRAICCNFALEPQSQKRVLDAIIRLRKYGSYDRIIWFGFGVKNIVTDLSETEQGLTLIALTAALSISYDSVTVAQVLRELCSFGKSSEGFTPALRQWKILVDLCAGILTSSDFVHVHNGIRRLMQLDPNCNEVLRCCTTTPSNLASAILTLGRVTRKMVDSVTIVGGLDCAWLAAFADWVLSLDIGILDSTGKLSYRSLKGTNGTPEVFFKLLDEPSSNMKADLAISKRYKIRSGETLFCPIDEQNRSRSLRFSASWETILQDSFSETDNLLAHEVTSQALAHYLYSASYSRRADWELSHRFPKLHYAFNQRQKRQKLVDPLLWLREESKGHQFLQLAVKWLPELQTCFQANFSTMAISEMETIEKAAKKQLESTCLCYEHLSEPKPQGLITKRCLSLIAETIFVYLWIIVASEIDDDICPSISGLQRLYSHQEEGLEKGDDTFYEWKMVPTAEDTGLGLVFEVFSGSRFIDYQSTMPKMDINEYTMPEMDIDERIALGGNGICVYRKILEDPTLSPRSIFTYRVVRGYITHDGSHYRAVDSLNQEPSIPESDPETRFSILDATIQPTITAVVEEQAYDANRLRMVYRIVHTTAKFQNNITWLSPALLLHKIRRTSRTWTCCGNCQPLDKLNEIPIACCAWRGWNDCKITANQDSIESVRDMINQIQRPAGKWVLTLFQLNVPLFILREPGRIIIREPFSLYVCLSSNMNVDESLYPFVQCLSCLVLGGVPDSYVEHRIKIKTVNQKEVSFQLALTRVPENKP